jgi:hypothetical protein
MPDAGSLGKPNSSTITPFYLEEKINYSHEK